eukprot:m.180862 g.180862  ORF g.180862 m.180862 type:complete len:598 (+) comp16864_c0_seq10:1219-3012(+)
MSALWRRRKSKSKAVEAATDDVDDGVEGQESSQNETACCQPKHKAHTFYIIYHDDDASLAQALTADLETIRLGVAARKHTVYHRERCGSHLNSDESKQAMLPHAIASADMVVILLSTTMVDTLQGKSSTAPEATMQLMMELNLTINDDSKANNILLAPLAPKASDGTRTRFPNADGCLPEVQACISQLLQIQWHTKNSVADTSGMASTIAKQWKHNRHALAKLKNVRQTGLAAFRSRIYQIRGNALAEDCLVADLNAHLPVNADFKCGHHGCLFHSIFISYRVHASRAFVRAFADHLEPLMCKEHRTMSPKVFLDQKCLPLGQSWRTSFLNVLRNCNMVIIVITPVTLERIKNPAGDEPDNVLLEWECALDLYEAGWIQLVVVNHSSLPKPTTEQTQKEFLAEIPDRPIKLLQHNGAEARPRLTALEIMESLLSQRVPWVGDLGLHEDEGLELLLPQEGGKGKGASEAASQTSKEQDASKQAVTDKMRKLSRNVDERWTDYFSLRQQGIRALQTSRQGAVLAAGKGIEMADKASKAVLGEERTAALKGKAKAVKNKAGAGFKAAKSRLKAALSQDEEDDGQDGEPTIAQDEDVLGFN